MAGVVSAGIHKYDDERRREICEAIKDGTKLFLLCSGALAPKGRSIIAQAKFASNAGLGGSRDISFQP